MSRSGVFITSMADTERIKVEGGVDVIKTVKAARTQRPHKGQHQYEYYQNMYIIIHLLYSLCINVHAWTLPECLYIGHWLDAIKIKSYTLIHCVTSHQYWLILCD